MRPTTLSIGKQQKHNETANFLREAFLAWSSKSRLNIVPEDKIQELFYEVRLYPTKQQVHDMLQTAKLFARRNSNYETASKFFVGLTYGEFCVLASDFRKFRTSSVSFQNGNRSKTPPPRLGKPPMEDTPAIPKSDETGINGPEVFLGGSCNPTTWRADVAIPALNNLGISFYNPQVSSWTPDLIELEHRAKEKARILFFVMDSETRATAAAIEVAHIAGQNVKHLVLVLHPYKPGQKILNESISNEEFLDLSRNQKLLQQLVSRRGLLAFDSIPSALQRIKGILSGEVNRHPPDNIASKLISVRRSFDRIAGKSEFGLTLSQCQNALTWLGYPVSLTTMETLKQILQVLKDIQQCDEINVDKAYINFEEYCILTSYLSILQQEISESSCVSPIKGTNLPPPPIFLSNSPEWLHNSTLKSPTVERPSMLHQVIYRSNTVHSCKSFSSDEQSSDCGGQNRDSGTSSPQPSDVLVCQKFSSVAVNVELLATAHEADESDSNDSVFSTGSSACSNEDEFCARMQVRDIYLGGSCMLRTRWRQDVAIPFLKKKGISYYLPTLHESLCKTHLNIIDDARQPTPSTSRCDSNSLSVDGKPHDVVHSSSSRSNSDDLIDCSTLFPDSDTMMYNPGLLDSSRVILFVITNETRSLAPMTLAAHCIGLGYNVVLCVQMLTDPCNIGHDVLTSSAVKDYNRGRAYLIDLAKRQGIPCFNEIRPALNCALDKVKVCKSRNSI